jgi:hypothetical protein
MFEDALYDDGDWPVKGKVLAAAGRRLTLDRTSCNYHDGMFLVLGKPYKAYDPDTDADMGEDLVPLLVESVTGNVVVLAEVPHGPVVNQTFYTLPRVTPSDISDFKAMDLMNLLQGLRAELKSKECIESNAVRNSKGLEIMGVTATEDDGGAPVMEKAWASCQRSMTVIKEKCLENGVMGGDSELCKRNEKLFTELLTIQSRLFEAEYNRRSFLAAAQGSAVSDTYVSTLFAFQAESTEDKKSSSTELMNYFLRLAGRSNLMHKGDIVYQQIYTTVYQWKPLPDNPRCESCSEYACFAAEVSECRARCVRHQFITDTDCRLFADNDAKPGYRRMHEDETLEHHVKTRAWCPMMYNGSVMDVRTWINLQIDQHTQPELWNKFFTYYGVGVATCERYISTANHPSFPAFRPDRNLFSFQNGMYDIRANKFYSYIGESLPENACCVHHVDAYFDPKWTEIDLADLRVPGYDDILDGQEYDVDMCNWLDTFLGRLFFPLGEFDMWEKLPVIKGWAATGKSTIAKAVMNLMGISNVGNIPANCEPQYALATVFDKFMWVCLEMCKTWAFPAAVLQSMISGEGVSVHAKHKTAVDVTWRAPGLAVGNDVPLSWVSGDGMGQLGRRVVPFPFDKAPANQDPTVQKRFMGNLGRFLVRITRRYLHTTLVVVREMTVDDKLPARLKASRSDFMKSTNPLLQFLEDSSDVILAPEDVRQILKLADANAAPKPRGSGSAGTLTVPGTVTSVSDHAVIHDLKMEWRIKLSDLNIKFREWWTMNGLPRNPPSAQSKTVYDSVVKQLGVVVQRDPADRNEYMIGVKASSSGRSQQAIVFGYAASAS